MALNNGVVFVNLLRYILTAVKREKFEKQSKVLQKLSKVVIFPV